MKEYLNMTDLRTLYGEYIDALNDRRLSDIERFAHEQLTFNGKPVSRADYIATIAAHLDCVPDFHWHVEERVIASPHAWSIRERPASNG